MGITPNKGFVKSAQIAGKVMGEYHPHGDSYGVMVNLTNPLSIRYNVFEGQGNFGFPLDGDGPAASRYTEAKLHPHGMLMLQDVDKKVVDFRPTYTEKDEEPSVLPSALPFLIVNGASGIATGYTTDIPSHNLGEVVDGVLALIKNKDITIIELMKYIKGPDLPTGAYLINNDQILKLYETGVGSLRYKAKMEIETSEDGKNSIIITELPPDVRKADVEKSPGLVSKIYNLCITEKKIPRVLAVRDESSSLEDEDESGKKKKKKKGEKEESSVRIVIELHKTAIPEVVMADLYKLTQLERTTGYTIRAIVNQAPALLNLKEMLVHYLEHRRDVVLRRNQFDLDKAKYRLHILEGFKSVFNNMDDVIKIIRFHPDAELELMTKYTLSKDQVTAIMNMPLRQLSSMNENKVDIEIQEKKDEIEMLEFIISNPSEIDAIIIQELKDMKANYSDARKTEIIEENSGISSTSLSTEPMVSILTTKNSIKQIPESALNDMINNGSLKERTEVYVQGVKCKVTDDFVLILETGEYVKTGFNDLAYIDYIDGKKIVGFFTVDQDEESNKNVIVMTKQGFVKKSKTSAFKARAKRTANYMDFESPDDKIISVKVTDGDEINNTVVLSTKKGIIHRFSENAFKSTNPGGGALACISQDVIKDGDEIADFDIVKKDNDDKNLVILYIKEADDQFSMKSMSLTEFITKGRVSKGILGAAKTFTGEVCKIKVTDDDFMILDKKGIVYKQKFVSIPIQNRYNKPNPLSFEPFIVKFFN
ncbi:DNA gyrase subunit A [compost metagenome]